MSMLESDLPPYAFGTPPRLHIKIHNPETGGKKWVLAKISSNPERHAGADQTSCRPPLSPCTAAEAMLIQENIHPRLCGHDVDLGSAHGCTN